MHLGNFGVFFSKQYMYCGCGVNSVVTSMGQRLKSESTTRVRPVAGHIPLGCSELEETRDELCSVQTQGTSHEQNRMLMRENKGFFLFAFDSSHVKYGV